MSAIPNELVEYEEFETTIDGKEVFVIARMFVSTRTSDRTVDTMQVLHCDQYNRERNIAHDLSMADIKTLEDRALDLAGERSQSDA